MTAEEYLKKLDASKLTSSALSLRKILSTFNGVEIIIYNGIKICSDDINSVATNVDFVLDKELTATCFNYEYGALLYTNPPVFYIALQNPNGLGYLPYKDWEKDLIENKVNPDIIKKIKLFLSTKPPIDY